LKLTLIKNLIILCLLVVGANAHSALIDSDSYTTDMTNDKYWTNNDLGLDIMRLSYSDLLNVDGTSGGAQADKATIDAWLSTQTEWRWVNVAELDDYVSWFYTTPLNGFWNANYLAGSTLFFDLNGVGPRWDTNRGYSSDGYGFWQIMSRVDDSNSAGKNHTAEIQINDPEYNAAEGKGRAFYSNNNSDPISYLSIKTNMAALLVRDINPIPEPTTFAIFALGIMGLASHRFKKQS
jgi:hypothetical protein